MSLPMTSLTKMMIIFCIFRVFPSRCIPRRMKLLTKMMIIAATSTRGASYAGFPCQMRTEPLWNNPPLNCQPRNSRGTVGPSMMKTGFPCQWCPNFEDLGYCLRGDMCHVEHGTNCIMVEDVQSSPAETDGSLAWYGT